jgi:hypothetical protein
MLVDDLATALDPARMMTRAGMTPDPWQAELLRSRAPRSLLLCTRQAGKSTATAALALWEAVYRPPALVLLLSPSLRQSSELFRKVLSFYAPYATVAPATGESALRLDLANGSRIVSLPGKEETVRGYSGVSLLILDEAARVSDSLYYSTRPMLATSQGRLIALSTPFGKRGWFHDAWMNGGGDWQRVKVTALQCPRISPAFLEEERAALGALWYAQEYLCEFAETEDSLFGYDLIASAITPDVAPLFAG